MPVARIGLWVFVVDQFSKWLILSRMTPGEQVPVIPSLFQITYSRNSGAAFGLFSGQTAFLLVVTVLVLAGILLYARRLGGRRRFCA